MSPFLRPAGFPFSDRVMYKNFIGNHENLKSSIVAMRNPFEPKQILYRRIIAVEGEWVQRMDDGGIIKVPNGHVWVECVNSKERKHDSLTDFGPLTKKLIIGKVMYTVWPIWRFTSMTDIEKFALFTVN